jgi:hypothetical protein
MAAVSGLGEVGLVFTGAEASGAGPAVCCSGTGAEASLAVVGLAFAGDAVETWLGVCWSDAGTVSWLAGAGLAEVPARGASVWVADCDVTGVEDAVWV